jgi:hypothetical protein
VPTGSTTSDLPLASTIADAYRRTFADRAFLIRAAGLWALVGLLGGLLAVGSGDEPGTGKPGGDATMWPALLFSAIGWIGLSAVTTHRIRALVCNDPPPRLMAPLDRHVARYILAEFVVAALAALPSLVALVVLAPIGGVPLALSAGTVAAIFLFARLHLALAAAAIGGRGIALELSWRATSSVWPKAAVGLIACSSPLALVASPLGAAIAAAGAPLTGRAIPTLTAFAQAGIFATFLASSWRRLVDASSDAT